MRRALLFLLVAVMLGASIYGVARLGRASGLAAGGGPEDFPLGSSLDGSRQGQQQQSGAAAGGAAAGATRHQHPPHVHEDVADRRAALGQQHAVAVEAAAAAVAAAGAEGGGILQAGSGDGILRDDAVAEQAALELEHLAELQRLEEERRGDPAAAAVAAAGAGEEGGALPQDPAVAAHVAAHIAAQQALPRRDGPSLYAANLSAVDIRGNVVHTADLAGRVTIVANVASNCGYTGAGWVWARMCS